MLLRHYLARGASKSALARQLGISRDTIHRWIRDGDLDRDLKGATTRYGPRPAVPTKLDAYKGIIEARLAAYPQLSAVRLLDEIRAAGYAGGYTQLKDFVRQVRPARRISSRMCCAAFSAMAGLNCKRDRPVESSPSEDET
jgi:transposase